MIFKDKTAIVTGAASGIGRKMTEDLYQKGCNVVACDIQTEKLNEIYAGFDSERLMIYTLDVTQYEHWKKMAHTAQSQFGTINWLFNIAGVIEPGYIYETPVQHIDRQIDINLKGTIYGVRVISEIMMKQKSGHIINISSMAGLAPIPGLNIYSATKFGIRGFSMAAASELEDFGVHVSVVCPDAVQTQMLDYQKDKKEAAMTFSANKYLTTNDLSVAIFKLLAKPRVQVWLPHRRGMLASAGAFFPNMTAKLKRKLIQKGLKKQRDLV